MQLENNSGGKNSISRRKKNFNESESPLTLSTERPRIDSSPRIQSKSAAILLIDKSIMKIKASSPIDTNPCTNDQA